ncbi:T9SS type A sorting domain-containing protein [Sphingobacteriales bacterium CHB3]|nr:T9SS type A sorting domain-containing protein [Sphingobacteriales bacterium CHB3]
MKTLWTFLLTIAFVLPTYAQQYGWVRVAQLGNQSTTLQAVEFVDSLHGWTASGSSAGFRTTDGGNTWLQCSFNAPIAIRAISMLNPTIGWCVGAQGTSPGRIMKTTDGGANWFQQFAGDNRNYLGTASLALTRNITSGYTNNFSPDTGKVVQTSNGGTTWTEQTIADSIGGLLQVQFIDSVHGWMLAGVNPWNQSGILKTSDGGMTWDLFRAPRYFQSFSFIDTLRGWAVNSNSPTYSYTTTDGGVTWTLQGRIYDPPWDDLAPAALSFVDNLNGWAFGHMFYQGDIAAVIFQTSDGGASWIREHVGGARRILDGMMLDRYHGWAVGGAGSVFAYRLVSSVPERLERSPKTFALKQNYPNPFNPTTTIEYEVIARGQVTIGLYDTQGKQVRSLVNGEHEPGVYRIYFDANGLASGVYYYTMKTHAFTETKQMILVK